jgi:putative lipoic acid-binding regulatory protein
MSDLNPPRIEFPCADYPIKVMGDATEDLQSWVMNIMERHAPGFDEARVTVRDSRNGRFQSVTVFITATGEPQLRAIFEDLKKYDAVKMVL